MNSIEKALAILLSFSPDNRPQRSVEISNRLDMNKATVNRILITLKSKGFVVQDTATLRYRLGPSTALLGRAVKKSLDGRLVAMAKPYLEDLRDKVGETVHLEILYDQKIILTFSAKGRQQVTVTPRVGDRMAINANAGAKAIMAFGDKAIIEKYLSGPLKKFTVNTETDPEKVRKQYSDIRATGFAYDKGEYDDDVYAVAAPVFNHEDQVIAAVVVVAPSFRMSSCIESGSLELLKDTATDISGRLLKV